MRQQLLFTVCAIFATQAHAEDQIGPEGAPSDESAIIVTGTRSLGRKVLESSTPIDVVSSDQIATGGQSDLGRALAFLEPSVNFARSATTATATDTRPFTLRGLAPDQTLVLVNGKRWHATSVLNVNNSIGRGSAAVDLDTIPESAIERIEILRDGASAQYGSDAIAGVVNIILKSSARGGEADLFGAVTSEGDGLTGQASASAGLPLGHGGHLTLSGLFRHEDPTNRANVDQRFGTVTYRIGDPFETLGNLAFDMALPVGEAEIYAFASGTRKIANNGAGFRLPGYSPVWPNGFLPIIEPRIWDAGGTIGVRGTIGGIHGDLSYSYGFDQADFSVFDTANVSLGSASPTRFDSGGVTYRQQVVDLTLSHPLDGVLAGGNVAIGGQFRRESYSIRNGEPAAYFGLGADGFAGFNPRNPTNAARNAYAGFLDVELRPVRQLLLGAALRDDDYSDFGGKATWRVTARFEPVTGLALRGTLGNGFKAPSLQQQYFSAVQGALSGGSLVTVGTLPVSDPIAIALGASPLKPERSRNWTAGGVMGPFHGFSFSADYFHIAIKDRIVLSEQLAGAAVTAALVNAGITQFQQVRFFTNALDTTTDGVELTARWSGALARDTRLKINAGFGSFSTTLDRLAANPVLPSLPLLGTKSILLATAGQPKNKTTVQAELTYRRAQFGVDFTRFGSYRGAPLVATQTFGAKSVVDLNAAYSLARGVRVEAGVLNLFDVHSDPIADQYKVIASTGGSFPTGEESPIGLNGRSFFTRLSASF